MAENKLGNRGDFTLVVGVITQVISGRGPTLYMNGWFLWYKCR